MFAADGDESQRVNDSEVWNEVSPECFLCTGGMSVANDTQI